MRSVPTYDADAVLLGVLAATPVVILLALTVPAHARRAWGWLCERVARAAYQRGEMNATIRVGNQRYLDGVEDGRRQMAREVSMARLVVPAKAAGKVTPAKPYKWGGRLAHLNPPPGFNDSEGDEAL